ncbi:MAG: hypothetical protein MJ175_11805 [Clostridia bacterium]|nr:hypothetical protein [Clostridia bacterium]
MMNRKTLTAIAGMILAAQVLTLASCGDAEPTKPTDTAAVTGNTADTAAEEVDPYAYPELDLGGKTFTILNTNQEYGFYSTLDLESTTGDGLDDAVYARNRKLEQKFNFKLQVNDDYLLDAAATALKTSVLAQDDAYDAAFIRDYYMATPLTEGYVQDMSDCDKLHFSEPWWDTAAIEQARLGDAKKILYAFTDISFADFEGTICCFFNEKLLTNLDIALPYQAVLDGKWTLDRMKEIMVAGTNLNGDSNFAWDASGNAVYGLVSWAQCTDALLIGCDLDYFTIGKQNNIEIAAGSEKFINRSLKVIDMLGAQGHYLHINNSGDDHYEMAFKHNRSMLMVAELKASNKYRDMDESYGIVPMPKYDESQENYRNLRGYLYVMCVPSTCQDLDTVGTIMDAMSYLTYKDVMPYFYNSHLSQKMLRNDESVQMLDIIRQTRYNDIGITYGLADMIRPTFRNAINKSSSDLVSAVEAVRKSIEKKIETAMDSLNEN